MELSGTSARLTRAALPFRPTALQRRLFLSLASGEPSAARIECAVWHEGSLGDPMHKLILVLSGQIDVEGRSGGWLVIPNHLIFIPADRQFNLRIAGPTVIDIVHLDPADCAWRHEGCWVTAASTLAHELIAYALRLEPGSEAARQIFPTLSYLCRDWFANPRMLFVPAAQSPELRAVVAYIRDNLADATVAGARVAAGLPQRTLHRRCRQEFGFGLRTLIREVRIMRAMEMLAGKDPPIKAVAQAVGFQSIPSFTAAFSQRLGVSPREFMRTSRAANPSASLRAPRPASLRTG